MTTFLEDTASARISFRHPVLFIPPGLTNVWGSCQGTTGVMGIRNLLFPPYSQGDSTLATLTVNECCIPTAGLTINYRWRADRIERSTRLEGFDIETVTVMPPKTQSACIRLAITNTCAQSAELRLRIRSGEGVVHAPEAWNTPYPPREGPAISVTPWAGDPPPRELIRNRIEPLPAQGALCYHSQTSRAVSLQAVDPTPDSIEGPTFLLRRLLGTGESFTTYFHVGIAATIDDALRSFEVWKADPEKPFGESARFWEEGIAAAFDPDDVTFSGCLPTLHTRNASLKRVYDNAVMAALYMRREHPDSSYGRTYVTLAPAYWQTTSFINDWSLSSLLLNLLDPTCARHHIEMWLQRDIFSHFGTEYASGANSGNWYSCNDYAMTRLISHHLRVTGDRQWLHAGVGGNTIIEHLVKLAWHYQTLDRGSGLADFGGRNSLLEAVGSYQHEVASLNAAAVWILREVAEILRFAGQTTEADRMHKAARAQVVTLRELYVPGSGFWNCRYPDGSLIPVRHIWDFIHTFNLLETGDLPPSQRQEMLDYYFREHHTPNWCRALSPLDDDIDFSLRPDHQWNGSYPAWVALALRALVNGGRDAEVAAWLPGLASSANQGPYSQAHFSPEFAPDVSGGARKAPTEWPYINDWMNLAAGAFFDTIVESLFGVELGIDQVSARPRIQHLDPQARLENLCCAGMRYHVDARGAYSAD